MSTKLQTAETPEASGYSTNPLIGRCGRVDKGTGHIVAVDDSGRYCKFKRAGKIKARWYRMEDVKLHEPAPCGCGEGLDKPRENCIWCHGTGVHEFRIPLNSLYG